MHYTHFILVHADNTEEAIAQAEAAIEPYGDGEVWDYYEVIEEAWASTVPAGPISLKQNKAAFLTALQVARSFQRESLADYLAMVIGLANNKLDPEAVGRQAAAIFENMTRRLMAGELPVNSITRTLSAGASPDLDMSNYAMRMALEMAAGKYISHSHFFDATKFDAAVMTDAEAEEAYAKGADLWIVPMSLHN